MNRMNSPAQTVPAIDPTRTTTVLTGMDFYDCVQLPPVSDFKKMIELLSQHDAVMVAFLRKNRLALQVFDFHKASATMTFLGEPDRIQFHESTQHCRVHEFLVDDIQSKFLNPWAGGKGTLEWRFYYRHVNDIVYPRSVLAFVPARNSPETRYKELVLQMPVCAPQPPLRQDLLRVLVSKYDFVLTMKTLSVFHTIFKESCIAAKTIQMTYERPKTVFLTTTTERKSIKPRKKVKPSQSSEEVTNEDTDTKEEEQKEPPKKEFGWLRFPCRGYHVPLYCTSLPVTSEVALLRRPNTNHAVWLRKDKGDLTQSPAFSTFPFPLRVMRMICKINSPEVDLFIQHDPRHPIALVFRHGDRIDYHTFLFPLSPDLLM